MVGKNLSNIGKFIEATYGSRAKQKSKEMSLTLRTRARLGLLGSEATTTGKSNTTLQEQVPIPYFRASRLTGKGSFTLRMMEKTYLEYPERQHMV